MPGTPAAFAEEIVVRAVRERTRPLRVREKVPMGEQQPIPTPRAVIQGKGPRGRSAGRGQSPSSSDAADAPETHGSHPEIERCSFNTACT